MPRSDRNSSREDRSVRLAPGTVVPWSISIGLHVALIIMAVFIVWSIQPAPEPPPPVVISFDQPTLGNAPQPMTRPTEEPVEAESLPELETPQIEPPSVEELLEQSMPHEAEMLVREGADEQATWLEERRFPEIRFAGLGASNAQSVVYVVDGSGSMVSTLPVVTKELKASIRKLAPTQRFQVIFFQNNRYVSAPDPLAPETPVQTTRLIRASQSNIKAVSAWLDEVLPRGRSNPIPALEVALSLKPDAVFVLSNVITGLGEWEADKDAILSSLEQLNPVDRRTGRRQVAIMTIQFLDRDPSGILEAIGTLHGGADGYNFISREELNAR